MKTLLLDGHSLTLDDLAGLHRGESVQLKLAEAVRPRVERSRAMVDETVASGEVVYGLTTGFGKLKNVAIAGDDLNQLQRNLILSHCCGFGDPMPMHEVRAAQVMRLNGLLVGHSGVRMELIEKLLRLFNKGFIPIVPQKGSVGASGDLAPLSHMAAAYMGHGEAWVDGRRGDAAQLLKTIDEEPLHLTAKEGLAIINGTEIMKAVGTGVEARAVNISKAADLLAAASIEALFGSVRPFDARLAELKHNAGHGRASANVRACLEGSEILASHVSCDRVQDPYSLRCVPQVHGAFKTALAHVSEVLTGEINSVTDNPLLFPDTGDVISAGQFHGQPVSMVLDYLALSLATIANISERRIEQLVNPDLSQLPAFLTLRPGLNSGLMIAQVAAAALASENKSLAHPASVDTVPTSANQEDHVSMGVTAARKAREICDNVECILGVELVAACQGLDFHRELRPGRGVGAAFDCLRAQVPMIEEDRYLQPDLEAARALIASGELVAAVEAAGVDLQA